MKERTDMSKSITSTAKVKPLRICKRCIYYESKYNVYIGSTGYCRKIKAWMQDSEYMKKDCVRLNYKEVEQDKK